MKIITRCPILLFLCFFLFSCQQQSEPVVIDRTIKKPNNTEAAQYNTQLGIAYLRQGNTTRAKKKLLLAMQQAPDSPEVNAAMGYYLENTGDANEAGNYYQKALKLSNQSGAQLNNYGTFLCRQGQYNDAIRYFMQATQDAQYVNTAAAYENAGLCALQVPDKAKAITYFDKALAQDPDRKQSLYQLVLIKKEDHQDKEALMLLQRYAQMTYHDKTLLNLGVSLARRAGDDKLAGDYQTRLNQFDVTSSSGVNNDDDSYNG